MTMYPPQRLCVEVVWCDKFYAKPLPNLRGYINKILVVLVSHMLSIHCSNDMGEEDINGFSLVEAD